MRHFLRHAVEPAEIGGQRFEAGDRLLLSYRLRSIEPAGPPELSRAIFVGGHKHLPIRYEVA